MSSLHLVCSFSLRAPNTQIHAWLGNGMGRSICENLCVEIAVFHVHFCHPTAHSPYIWIHCVVFMHCALYSIIRYNANTWHANKLRRKVLVFIVWMHQQTNLSEFINFIKWYYFVRTYEKYIRLIIRCATGSTNMSSPIQINQVWKEVWHHRLGIFSDLFYGELKWPTFAARHFHRTISLQQKQTHWN